MLPSRLVKHTRQRGPLDGCPVDAVDDSSYSLPVTLVTTQQADTMDAPIILSLIAGDSPMAVDMALDRGGPPTWVIIPGERRWISQLYPVHCMEITSVCQLDIVLVNPKFYVRSMTIVLSKNPADHLVAIERVCENSKWQTHYVPCRMPVVDVRMAGEMDAIKAMLLLAEVEPLITLLKAMSPPVAREKLLDARNLLLQANLWNFIADAAYVRVRERLGIRS